MFGFDKSKVSWTPIFLNLTRAKLTCQYNPFTFYAYKCYKKGG
jgi:hypothetical protein